MRESLNQHVPIAGLVSSKPNSPQPIPQSIDLGLTSINPEKILTASTARRTEMRS